MLSFLRKHWYIPVAIVVLLCGLTALYVYTTCHSYGIPQTEAQAKHTTSLSRT